MPIAPIHVTILFYLIKVLLIQLKKILVAPIQMSMSKSLQFIIMVATQSLGMS